MKHWNAVILAGDRSIDDPVAKAAHVSCKAEARIASRMLLDYVVSALAQSQSVRRIFSVGPEENVVVDKAAVNALFKKYEVTQLPVEPGPSLSALRGVEESAHYPTLIVTCDLPLLNAGLVDKYCQHLNSINEDFVISAVNSQRIASLLPELRKTKYQFGKNSICFANLFAVLTESGMNAIDFWRSVEGSRKKPLEVIRQVGGFSILQYKLGMLSLDQAARQLSRKTAAQIAIEDIPYPELAIDVDTVNDYEILQKNMHASG